jgi:hypothetical protein
MDQLAAAQSRHQPAKMTAGEKGYIRGALYPPKNIACGFEANRGRQRTELKPLKSLSNELSKRLT